ncbi:phosphonate ABC transporter ATP-binding protein [Roseospira goensis]|uniref:Phosphonate transport system ATP-binding protein n=1 Tax=Roseospira goensis TaxID=391922 RepID=A0A7W6RWX2_9PROT|nr:phosphonate ABC transporter ATP-binding protein [Roseospira goensis]MBB4284748.1 phosphonate transport system ATP-binding protein [Roseospira goensis]
MRVIDLNKTFGSVMAVKSASFDVPGAQMIGVIGRSGAGKSTLLRMINHLTPATSGSILIDGRDILALRGAARHAWQRDCAMIFQQFNLVPRLDVLTNVMLGRLNRHGTLRSLLKVFGREDIARGLHALERLGIADQALKRAEDLSGGQQQRVAIARALTQDPRMILADEPIASLDPMSAQVVMDSLRQIHERDGLTVICNLHTLDTARTYCDRVIGMRDGAIVYDGPAHAVTTDVARDIYGADDSFNEGVTSTVLEPDDRRAAEVAYLRAAEAGA